MPSKPQTKKQIMKIKLQKLVAASLVASIALTACNNEADKTDEMKDTMAAQETVAPAEQGVMVGGAMMLPSKDIVDNAAASADHSTLVAAVKAAELVETLKGAGPFTVFAPTNEAFGKLPAGTVEKLLEPASKADLTGILTYHVVAGAFKSTDLKDGQKVKTVQGGELTIGYKDNKWTVTDAKGNVANITVADVVSSNGVTFVIDAVLLP